MKKKLSFILALLMIFCMIPAAVFTVGAAATVDETLAADKLKHLTGEGTEASPYLIGTTEDWIWFAAASYYSPLTGKFFKLTADLDFSGYYQADGKTCKLTTEQMQAYCEKWSANTVWFMIANQSVTSTGTADMMWFSGTLDGNGHSVGGFYWESNQNIAVVRHAAGATVKNLTLKNSTFYLTGGGDKCVAGIIAECRGIGDNAASKVAGRYHTTVSNCVVEGSVTLKSAKRGKVGGIVGGTGSYAGGKIGEIEIKNCTSYARMTGATGSDNNWYAGIIALISGDSVCGTVENCTALGTIEVTAAHKSIFGIGGIIGEANGNCTGMDLSNAVVIKDCVAGMNIYVKVNTPFDAGKAGIGGIAGHVGRTTNRAGDTKIENCLSFCKITTELVGDNTLDNLPVGSIVGQTIAGNGKLHMNGNTFAGKDIGLGTPETADPAPVVLTAMPAMPTVDLSIVESEKTPEAKLTFYMKDLNSTGVSNLKVNGEAYQAPTADKNGLFKISGPALDIQNLSKAMMISFTYTLKDNGGAQLWSGDITYSNSIDDSINKATGANKLLLSDLVDYGKYANRYFGGIASSSAVTLKEEEVPVAKAVTADDSTGISFRGATVAITDKTTLRLYFRIANGTKVSDFHLTANGKAVELTARDGGWYTVDLDAPAKDFGTQFTIKNGDKVIAVYGMMNYCSSVYEAKKDSFDAELKPDATQEDKALLNVIASFIKYQVQAEVCYN